MDSGELTASTVLGSGPDQLDGSASGRPLPGFPNSGAHAAAPGPERLIQRGDNMRYKLIILVAAAILLFSLSGVCGAKTVLSMNHQFPPDTVGSRLDQWFADRIKKDTQGEVEIKIFWNNGLGEPDENLSLLKNDHIDMAAMSAGYYPDQLPLFSAPNSIPMGMDDVCQAGAIMQAFIEKIPAFAREAAGHGIRPVFFHLLNPYLLVSKKPVRSFEDLKGLRIRTWGSDMPRLVKAAGAVPVSLYLPDIFDAMKHGAIDACPFSVDLTVSYKIYELARYVTEVVLWEGPSWGIWISQKAWDQLKDDQRQIFQRTAELAREKELHSVKSAEVKARKFLLDQGMVFVPFAPQDLDKWKAASPDFMAGLVQRLEKLGQGEAGRDTVRLWLDMRKNIRCP